MSGKSSMSLLAAKHAVKLVTALVTSSTEPTAADSFQLLVSVPALSVWSDRSQDSDDNSTAEPADDQVWTPQPMPPPPVNPAMQRLVQGEIAGASGRQQQ